MCVITNEEVVKRSNLDITALEGVFITYVHVYTYTHTGSHTYMYIHIHTYIRTYIHTYIHTVSQSRMIQKECVKKW